MTRGFDAVDKALAAQGAGVPPGRLLILVGKTLVSTVGGASGPLWGSAFRAMGRALGDGENFDGAALADAVDAALAAVVDLGAASVGDKTMVDALVPASAALRAGVAADASLADAARAAADAAEAGARGTSPMQARKGRASYLGERSIGHQDPGATSAVLIMRSLQTALAQED
jgi:dihydroxyacetone kinase-like protein